MVNYMNNKNLYLKYIDLTIKNGNQKVIKQVLFSLIGILGIIFISYMDIYLIKMIVLIYLLLSSFISVIENETFLNMEDLENFLIKSNDKRFPWIYLIQRYFRDTYIFNTIMIVILFIYMIFIDQRAFLWLCITILFYYFSLPFEYTALYRNKNLIILNVVIKLLLIIGIVILYVNNCYILDLNLVVYTLIWILYIGAQLILSNKKYLISRSNSHNSNMERALRIIKKYDIFVFKDIIMNYKFILIALIGSILMVFLIGTSSDEIYPTLAICILLDSYLSNKNDKKQYRIAADDTLFWDPQYQISDLIFLKQKKFYTFIFITFIKNIVMISLLILNKSFSLSSYYSLFILSFITCINDYIRICSNENRIKCIYIVANYMPIFTYMCVTFIGHLNIFYINIIFTIILVFALIVLVKNIKEVNL